MLIVAFVFVFLIVFKVRVDIGSFHINSTGDTTKITKTDETDKRVQHKGYAGAEFSGKKEGGHIIEITEMPSDDQPLGMCLVSFLENGYWKDYPVFFTKDKFDPGMVGVPVTVNMYNTWQRRTNQAWFIGAIHKFPNQK